MTIEAKRKVNKNFEVHWMKQSSRRTVSVQNIFSKRKKNLNHITYAWCRERILLRSKK